MAKAAVGEVTVKVVPDITGMEPAIRAELDRIGAAIGQVDRDELAAMLGDAGLTRGVHPKVLADRILERFVVFRRKDGT